MEQRILLASNDINMNPLGKHENQYKKRIETLWYVNLIWKELEF